MSTFIRYLFDDTLKTNIKFEDVQVIEWRGNVFIATTQMLRSDKAASFSFLFSSGDN